MKELSIEQKAKAYDEALKVLHKYDGANIMFSQSLKEEMFPELKESEDERIELLNYLYDVHDDDEERARWIAWLEKQDDTNETINRDEFAQGVLRGAAINLITWIDYNAAKGNMCLSNIECKDIENALVSGDWDKIYAYIKKKLEKQGEQKPIDPDTLIQQRVDALADIVTEQKPTDKVEPKFKVGNWYQCTKDFFGKGVTFDKNTAYYCAKEGCLQNEYGCHIAIVKDLYDNFKLWTIQDAKEGDVLVCPKYAGDIIPNIFIFKNIETKDNDVFCYCSFLEKFRTESYVANADPINTDFYPATKEQCDLLFQKMKEVGYEWDAKKKELKKIVVPIFNIGDTIAKKHNSDIHDFGSFTITDITGGKYWYNDRIICDITEQDGWEIYEPVGQNHT